MNISKLTKGQKEFLYESLKNQKSEMTKAEVKTLAKLREDLAEPIAAGHYGKIFKTIDGFIKLTYLDHFGEDYRNRWVKIKENSKGEYFTMYYLGNRRLFLKY